ncbi:MAG: hypothetical protein MRY57_02425 [Candidatus Pacebacteria bacterium]|nr:hypothetical protein [Candidatus Paceibacterota bacterium]
MDINAKRIFELFLTLIIFYGVYSVFDEALPYLFPNIESFWVVIIGLVVSLGLLLLYSFMVSQSTTKKVQEKMNKTVSDLEHNLVEKESEVQSTKNELDNAFKIKKAVEDEAEKTV